MQQLQIYINNKWTNIELELLRTGDIFRIRSEDNKPIKDDKGLLVWECICDAFYNKELKKYCINTKRINIEDI
ncbi:hypothetical protein [Clostridium haemolyticum]|uniref:Uncharacterized protein n=1 Tax=Clostridium haemolyticum NCTC 9693 TaxID=1443114 RepID=A0ABR4TAZ1_CLOHA|nr:hypothetical protein [Clostridium haemolyticum]KEI14108.1 hypothetical protein Z960_p0114 [Clostridium haemolyticum NCTC 9693]